LSEINDIEHRYEETATLYNKTFDESVKADSDSETEQQNLKRVPFLCFMEMSTSMKDGRLRLIPVLMQRQHQQSTNYSS